MDTVSQMIQRTMVAPRCKDCKWAKSDWLFGWRHAECLHPEAYKRGVYPRIPCSVERGDFDLLNVCGPSAKRFEAKPPSPPMTEETLPWVIAGFLAVLIAFMALMYHAGYERGATGKLRSSCEIEKPHQLRAGWYRAP